MGINYYNMYCTKATMKNKTHTKEFKMYKIENCDADIEAGYPEYQHRVSEIEHAFAAVIDAEAMHGIPSHRLTVSRYLQDSEAEDGQYLDWSLNAECFMANNQAEVAAMTERLRSSTHLICADCGEIHRSPSCDLNHYEK